MQTWQELCLCRVRFRFDPNLALKQFRPLPALPPMSALKGKRSTDPSSSSPSTYIRSAIHSGSWYPAQPSVLFSNLESYYNPIPPPLKVQELRASFHPRSFEGAIVPHAGYSYCGSTGGIALQGLQSRLKWQRGIESDQSSTGASSSASSSAPLQWKDPSNWVKTIVVLHPSHHLGMDGVGLLQECSQVATPLGNLSVAQFPSLESSFLSRGVSVRRLTSSEDEAEHSSEMMYPHLKFILNDVDASSCDASIPSLSDSITIFPIMVGSVSFGVEQAIAQVLSELGVGSPHDRSFFTVLSSDFCHYGTRFGYTPSPPSAGPPSQLFEFIQSLDESGMSAIAGLDHRAFSDYLKTTRNTICGRHPIGVYLALLQLPASASASAGAPGVNITFVDYKQSSKVVKKADSSVSYAGAIIARAER